MFLYRNNRLVKKPVILLVILAMVLITGFINFRLERLYQRNIIETLVRYAELIKLRRIQAQIQHNYQTLQAMLLAKTWKEKFAMYSDKEIVKYLGPNNLNVKLLEEAKQISKRYKINIDSEILILTYFYKEKNNDTVIGFLGYDYARLRIAQ